MKVDISRSPDPDIFRNRKSQSFWFSLFFVIAIGAIGVGAYVMYVDTKLDPHLVDWALGVLVVSSLFITRFGNRLQAYKELLPPEKEKLAKLRQNHPVIDKYCSRVEKMGRRIIRAEYEACVDYAEDQEDRSDSN